MKKLVRDRIPELSGKKAEKVTGNTYRAYLDVKLREKANELLDVMYHSFKPDFLEKMKGGAADIITVVLALCNTYGLCWEEIEEEIKRKGKEKGGFGAGFVVEVEG